MNIFEGARRITKIIAVMWVIGWAYNLATWDPPILSKYEITAPDGSKHIVDVPEGATEGQALEYFKSTWNAHKTAVLGNEFVNPKVSPLRWEKIKLNSLWTFGGLAFLFIFSWSIGWIVRGFAGIPSGQDKKPDDI